MGYYTVKEAVEELKVHRNTIWKWLANGTIKGVKFGKLWRIPDTEIEKMEKK